MSKQPTRLQFGKRYSDAMADAQQRLRMLKTLIDHSRSIRGNGHPEETNLRRDLFSLIGQVCRIVASAWSPNFGFKPYRPILPKWPSRATHRRLFRSRARQFMPAYFDQPSIEELEFRPLPEKCMLPEHFESMHDTAEMVYRGLDAPVPVDVDLEELALTVYQHLFDALSMHVIQLPELGGIGFSRFELSEPGGAHWFMVETQASPPVQPEADK